MPRVVTVNSADGIQKSADTLARGLSDQGYEVCVIRPDHLSELWEATNIDADKASQFLPD